MRKALKVSFGLAAALIFSMRLTAEIVHETVLLQDDCEILKILLDNKASLLRAQSRSQLCLAHLINNQLAIKILIEKMPEMKMKMTESITDEDLYEIQILGQK